MKQKGRELKAGTVCARVRACEGGAQRLHAIRATGATGRSASFSSSYPGQSLHVLACQRPLGTEMHVRMSSGCEAPRSEHRPPRLAAPQLGRQWACRGVLRECPDKHRRHPRGSGWTSWTMIGALYRTVSGSTPGCGRPARPDPVQIVLARACLYGRGACADFTLKTAALIKTNPTEWTLFVRQFKTCL